MPLPPLLEVESLPRVAGILAPMRFSQLFARTLKEAPAEAEAPSHRLLLRAAFVRKVMSGVYTFLPLGLRTLRKVEAIVREEMDRAGAQEVLMPAILPAEPWKVTGRWDAYGEDMFKLKDRSGRELGLGPTHEEVVTPLVDGDYESYRDLPVCLYQVQWKYRDEPRPRGGLIRAREFLMKDAYSFDRDVEGLRASYGRMVEAYKRIFDRCGLTYRIVEADPGLIGGDVNHEFMAPADVGEDLFVSCTSCDYAANLEAATCLAPAEAPGADLEPLTEVHTPGRPGIRDVVELLGRPASEVLKCILYDVGGEPVAVLVPGDREVNEGKLARAMAPATVRMFTEEDFERLALPRGYVGPAGLPGEISVVADHSVRGRANWVTGANRADYHVAGANPGRDFRVDRWEDLTRVADGDPCPRCGHRLRVGRAIEVGHCFQLGTRYSEPLKATFLDEEGIERPFVMGCYGVGVSRVVAAVAEQHRDEAGLAWPKAVAPYHVMVIPTNMDQPEVREEAERVYRDLGRRGVEVVLDDREVSAGVKFADADLVGFPVQVVVGARGLAEGVADLKVRAGGERTPATLEAAADRALELLGRAP